MRMHRAVPFLGLGLLAGVVLLSEAWGFDPHGNAPLDPVAKRRQEVLDRLPGEQDLLINLDPVDLPATSDLIRLGKPATPGIINGLVNSMSPQVRSSCAAVLTATRDPRAMDPLLDALDDPEMSVRYRALDALGSIEGRKATPRLLTILKQKAVPADIKEQGIRALGRLGDPAAVDPLLAHFKNTWDPATQQALWDLRAHLGARVGEIVLGPLRADPQHPAPYDVLAFAIERAGDLRLKPAVPLLVRLADETPDFRNRIIFNLGRIGDPAALPFLKGLLDSTAEARLLNNVVFALQRLGESPAPFLHKALKDRRAYIRFNAAFVAGDLKVTALVPQLLEALKDPNDFVRSEVAVALGKIRSPDAAKALEAASQEENATVKRDALLALAQLDYPRFRARVVEELVAHRQRSVRMKAVAFLAERGDPAVVSPVLAVLDPFQYEDAALSISLLDRFDTLDNADATALLLRVAAGPTGQQHQALRLLARFHDERARFALRQWLHAPGGEQDQLMRALGLLADRESLALARPWLDSKAAASPLYAAFLLASLGQKAGADRLRTTLEEAPVELKRVGSTLLTELDLSRVPGLRDSLDAMLVHPDVYVRLYAARTLAARGEEKAWRTLKAELDKKVPFIRDEVLDMVGRVPERYRRPAVEGWMRTADPLLKQDLEETLKERRGGAT